MPLWSPEWSHRLMRHVLPGLFDAGGECPLQAEPVWTHIRRLGRQRVSVILRRTRRLPLWMRALALPISPWLIPSGGCTVGPVSGGSGTDAAGADSPEQRAQEAQLARRAA